MLCVCRSGSRSEVAQGRRGHGKRGTAARLVRGPGATDRGLFSEQEAVVSYRTMRAAERDACDVGVNCDLQGRAGPSDGSDEAGPSPRHPHMVEQSGSGVASVPGVSQIRLLEAGNTYLRNEKQR